MSNEERRKNPKMKKNVIIGAMFSLLLLVMFLLIALSITMHTEDVAGSVVTDSTPTNALDESNMTFHITATSDSGSTISPKSVDIQSGGSQTFTYSVIDGYKISALYIDGHPLSNPYFGYYTFTNVLSDHTISVISVPLSVNYFNIMIVTNDKLTITDTSNITVQYGDDKTVFFSAPSEYKITNVLIDGAHSPYLDERYDSNGNYFPPAGSYTFHNVTSDHVVTVNIARLDSSANITTGNANNASNQWWNYAIVFLLIAILVIVAILLYRTWKK